MHNKKSVHKVSQRVQNSSYNMNFSKKRSYLIVCLPTNFLSTSGIVRSPTTYHILYSQLGRKEHVYSTIDNYYYTTGAIISQEPFGSTWEDK